MSERQPAVSVLMTAFNRERYIGAAIESVLAQTCTDFELVIVDDRSTDASVEIARQYAAQDSRIRVSVNERNLGDYPNRNHAASLARGRFLKYHDSDDLLYPHCLEVMVGALESEPRAGFALSGGSYWQGGPVPLLSTPRLSYQREFLGFGLFNCGPAGALFRTDIFRELGGFANHGPASDHVFWLRACARYPVLLLPADLFWYRTHEGQELRGAAAAKAYARVPGHVWQALSAPECPLEPAEREVARRNVTWSIAKQVVRDFRAGNAALAWYRCQQSGLGIPDWLKYLRRPQRSALAGTPLTADGDYVVPAWCQAREGEPTR
jgi:hypothetical protein